MLRGGGLRRLVANVVVVFIVVGAYGCSGDGGNLYAEWATKCSGLPFGKTQLEGLEKTPSYRFTGSRATRTVERLNSQGELIADEDGAARYVFARVDGGWDQRRERSDGTLVESRQHRGAACTTRSSAAQGGASTFRRYGFGQNSSLVLRLDGEGRPRTEDGVAMILYDDENEWRFDHRGRPLHGQNGHYLRILRDADGKLLERSYFGVLGEPTVGKDGFHRRLNRSDREGNLISARFFGRNDKPVPGPEGAHEFRQKYVGGDRVRVEWFDVDGHPTSVLGKGYSRLEQRFEQGRLVSVARFGPSGRPVPVERCDEDRTDYDQQGRVSSRSCWLSGAPALRADGWHHVRYRRNAAGKVVEWSYFDVDGLPGVGPRGVHRVMDEYDERGNLAARALFGRDGSAASGRDGYHRWVASHDGDRMVEQRFIDEGGEPTVNPAGQHRITWTDDDDGHAKELATDAGGVPVVDREASNERTRRELDDQDRAVARWYVDAAGLPTVSSDGYHRAELTLDSWGRTTRERLFGLGGARASGKLGYHLVTSHFDDRGDVVERAWFAPDDSPTLREGGYHRVVYERDARGRNVREARFGVNGEPVVPDGFHSVKNVYGSHDQLLTQASFGGSAEPVAVSGQGHLKRFRYDVFLDEVEVSWRDIAGRPALNKEGWHRRVLRRDARGQVIEKLLFDEEGRPTGTTARPHRTVMSRDGFGRIIQWRYFAAEGAPTLHPKWRAHRIALTRDAWGRERESRFFGIDDKPAAAFEGHRRERLRSGTGEILEVRRHGPFPEHNVCRVDRLQRDEKGRVTLSTCVDAGGKPAAATGGLHRTSTTYDDRGNTVRLRTFGLDGPVAVDGVHETRHRYDIVGRLLETQFTGPSGEPATDKEGCHRLSRTPDEWGRPGPPDCVRPDRKAR